MNIPVMRPRLPSFELLQERLSSVEKSGIYSNHGPQVLELEERFAKFFGVESEQVVLVSSATMGIAAAVALSAPSTAWHVPAWTFTATISGILAGGGSPKFCDVDLDSGWILTDYLEETKLSVVAVAPFGAPIPPEVLQRPAPTVIDAAASIGNCEGELGLLSAEVSVVFSLHATKVLGIGEGGIVVCGSADNAKEIRSWTNFGFDGSRNSRRVGLNANMSEFTAVVGHAALDQWPVERREWLDARERAREISSVVGLSIQDFEGDFISPYWMVLFPSEESRQRVEDALSAEGIGTRRWWERGCHLMPAYQQIPATSLARTSKIAGATLGLPFYRGLSERDAGEIRKVLGSCS